MNERDASLLIDEVYDSLYVHLVNYAVHLGSSVELAEDAAQETFLRLYRALRDGQTIREPKAWAYTVMRHEMGKQLHGHAEQTVTAEGWRSLEESSCGNDAASERFVIADELEHLLDLLTEREKEVLLLRLGSLKYREIGEQLGISVKTVHTLLTRALGKLQQRMPETPGRKEDASVAEKPRPTLQ